MVIEINIIFGLDCHDDIFVFCASRGSRLKEGYSRLLAKKPEMAE